MTAKPWFRMYAEFASDPKVQMMPEVMQRRLVMLFCARCSEILGTSQRRHGDDGVTTLERQLAFHWRISDVEMAETKRVFLDLGFIDDDWNVLNWDKRQYISDSSTERTRRYRERMRTSQETSREQAKQKNGRHGDAPRAEQNRYRAEQNSRAETPEFAHSLSLTQSKYLSESKEYGILNNSSTRTHALIDNYPQEQTESENLNRAAIANFQNAARKTFFAADDPESQNQNPEKHVISTHQQSQNQSLTGEESAFAAQRENSLAHDGDSSVECETGENRAEMALEAFHGTEIQSAMNQSKQSDLSREESAIKLSCATYFDIDGHLDGEKLVTDCLALHPRARRGYATETAVIEAWEREAQVRGPEAAAEYLVEKTRTYAECVAKWPQSEHCFIVQAERFYSHSIYNETKEMWNRENRTNPAGKEEQNSRILDEVLKGKDGGGDGDRTGEHLGSRGAQVMAPVVPARPVGAVAGGVGSRVRIR